MELFCSNELLKAHKMGTAGQTRVFYWLIHYWRWQKEDTFTASVPKIKKDSRYRGFTYNETKKCNIFIPDRIVLDRGGNFKSIPVFGEMSVNKDTKEMRIEVSQYGKDFLNRPSSSFAKLDLNELSQMTSKFQIRMFEFLTINSNIINRFIKMDELKEFFEVKKTYNTKHFLDKINKSLDVINKKTKFKVSLELFRKNRTIHKVKFEINKRNTNIKKIPFRDFALNTSFSVEYVKYYLDTYKDIHKKRHPNYSFEKWEDLTVAINNFEGNCIQGIEFHLEEVIDEHLMYKYDNEPMYHLHQFTGEVKNNRAYEAARKHGFL